MINPATRRADLAHALPDAHFHLPPEPSQHTISTSMDWACLTTHARGVVLRLRVSPNASQTAAEGLKQDRLSLRLQAPPVEGKANEAVLKWTAKAFKIRLSHITLIRGVHSRQKDLLLEGLSPEQAAQTLSGLIPGK
jgi:uncharacterized protein